MKTYAFRLRPGQLLREEIQKVAKENNINAGVILACVGNLKSAVLRMADGEIVKTFEGTFEIVSCTGTVEEDDCHIHISISDEEGRTFGGHLKNGSVVGITAEVVIIELNNTSFRRERDETGYDCLVVESK